MIKTQQQPTRILFIHPRKGLFRVTKCDHCGHVFGCDHCDANLITYRSDAYKLMMLCHQCQTHYTYPNQCPQCNTNQISSVVGGADELAEELTSLFGHKPVRYDETKAVYTKKQSPSDTTDDTNLTHDTKSIHTALSTRVYDPLIPYATFDIIVFVHAENLFASPDYQVLEESMRQIAQVLEELNSNTTVFFDSKVANTRFFDTILALNHSATIQTSSWYTTFLEEEAQNRTQFQFPPFHNIILFTSQNKYKTKSLETITAVYNELVYSASQLPELSVTSPYEARFLKRKGMYSYHTLIRYPKNYTHFSQLRGAVHEIRDRFFVQVRLNPRHLF